MKSLFDVVDYCHNHDVYHRNLKSENCLFVKNESDVKVINFGLAELVTEEQVLNEDCRPPFYIASEILTGSCLKVVDCWSLGVILYMLLAGTPPFNGKDNSEILMNVYSGDFTFRPKPFRTVSNNAKDLIVRLLTKDPNHRITPHQAFLHP